MLHKSLTEMLAHQAEFHPDTLFVRTLKRGKVVATCTYAQTWERSTQWAALLVERGGIRRGEAVIIALPNSDDFVHAYFGTLLAGGIPAPIAPFRRIKDADYYLTEVTRRMEFLGAKILIIPDREAYVAPLSPLCEIEQLSIMTSSDLAVNSQSITPSNSEHDVGLLQFTSGTSGTVKAVQLTHAALLAQMQHTSVALAIDPVEDNVVSWLPLFHDMGLIGFLLGSALNAISITLLPVEDFMMCPNLWIKALSDFRASITGGPPSAYALCARRLKDSEVEQYDLHRVRIAAVGAEMVTRESLQKFVDKVSPAGFRATALMPAYGMAENCLSVTVAPLDQGPTFDTIDQDLLQTEQIAYPLHHPHLSTHSSREVTSVGIPLMQTEVAIVNGEGKRLGERHLGEIIVRSASLMQGYYGQLEATANALRDGWLWTGDLGYLANGHLYVTGRKKEVLIVGGRNYYPDDLERVAESVAGMRPDSTVAISYYDSAWATEAVVMLVETSLVEETERDTLRQRIRQVLVQAGYPISDIVFVRPKTLQTTMNGKPKRIEYKARYLAGEFVHDHQTSKSC